MLLAFFIQGFNHVNIHKSTLFTSTAVKSFSMSLMIYIYISFQFFAIINKFEIHIFVYVSLAHVGESLYDKRVSSQK